MNARVAAWILACAVVVSVGLFLGAARLTAHWSAARWSNPNDDLEWLRREFRLGREELARIRQLHEGYLPVCREWCARIAAKKAELEEELVRGGGFTPRAAELVRELAGLRAECQVAMLRHFDEVRRAMPPEQGRRYFEEMLRLTLTTHEATEQAMARQQHAGHEHP
ncbi:hypothetical protein G4L39_07755 [Limisphaera ngatamarikiensis]|uniref:Periplasmic heavy metal sensor n=1 Tax=Limisphaera ngatamarikiensis TaxID=1324935 RepID=A0A6M1RX03_9BACT|nr:periplasmic heavy metal sensor [Limisphaera ngatamarikiensis]NGO39292.1 hypothetical protein [Limisphaera ngatamarikiensis]